MSRIQPGHDEDAVRQAVTDACEALNLELDALIELMLGEDQDLPAEVFKIPYLTIAEGHGPPGHAADSPVSPQRLVGHEARWEAAAVISAWRYLADQDPRAVQRLPGVIAAGAATLTHLQRVNGAKSGLKKVLQNYREGLAVDLGPLDVAQAGSKYAQLRQESSSMRHLHVLQATRQLHELAAPASLVSFYWSSGPIITTTNLVVDLRADFEEAVVSGPPDVIKREERPGWDERFRSYLEAVRRMPAHEELVARRSTPPAPVARAVPALPGKQPFKASLPLFVSADATWPSISPLGNHDPKKGSSRKPRADRHVQDGAVIQDLNLYRYRPEYRDKLHAKLRWEPAGEVVTLKLTKGRWTKLEFRFPVATLVMAIQDVLAGRARRALEGVLMKPAGREGVFLVVDVHGAPRRVPWSRRNAVALLASLTPKR